VNERDEITPGDLPDYLRRAASAVYIAMDKVAADDLSPRLLEAANLLDRLTRQNDLLAMELQQRASRDVERRERMERQVDQARLGWAEHPS
jgi:hypothetical protein